MHSITMITAISAFLVGLSQAMVPPAAGGYLIACGEETCNDCGDVFDVNDGYPYCIYYNSADTLPADYENDSGMGWDVWWDSGVPNPGCKIVVRSPASFDVPACGVFLTDWADEGCYFTSLQDTFMLSYCCGGDCEAEEPSSGSIDEVHAMHLQGKSASTVLSIKNLNSTNAGAEDLGPAGSIKWRRSAPAMTHKARDELERAAEASENMLARDLTESKRCSDTYTESSRYIKGGEQIKVSPTQVCNSGNGCMLTISSTIETGESSTFTVDVNFEVFEASTSITFETSTSRGFMTEFSQDDGTNGYVSFTPTYQCTYGTYGSCTDGNQDGEACTPQLLPGGDQDGAFTFVFVQE